HRARPERAGDGLLAAGLCQEGEVVAAGAFFRASSDDAAPRQHAGDAPLRTAEAAAGRAAAGLYTSSAAAGTAGHRSAANAVFLHLGPQETLTWPSIADAASPRSTIRSA